MASPQELTTEELNYFKVCRVFTHTVHEGLKIVFKKLWDAKYQATHGQWQDTAKNGNDFYSMESPESRKRNSRGLAILRNGNRFEWDCTCLFFAILYSDTLGKGLDPVVRKSVDDLRRLRNNYLAHACGGRLTELNFQTFFQTVIAAFISLNLDIADVEAIKNDKTFPTKELRVIQQQLEEEKLRNEEPRPFCVLPPKSHGVIDRSGEVSDILEKMKRLRSTTPNIITVVYLSGNPGCGKSEIARQIGENVFDDDSENMEDQVKFVFTLNASSLDVLIQSYMEFACSLNCDPTTTTSIATSKALSREDKLFFLKMLVAPKFRKYYSSWLLIVDNVTDVKSVFRYLPQVGDKINGSGQILVITQDSLSIGANDSYSYHFSLSRDDTIPIEILARGSEALKAYEKALECGKTKNQRSIIMVVGPARAGKTSLLKSFNGEKFDSKENSTYGIQLQQTFCKPQENCWCRKDGDEGISYSDCMAEAICENLQGGDSSKEEHDEKIAEDRERSIQKSWGPSISPDGYGDTKDEDHGDHDDDDKFKEVNEETKKMESQEYIKIKTTSNLPKHIEEKVLVKLKDTESDQTKENKLYIKTLDFAGQAVYNVVYPIFLSSKAVFILVYNLRNILHDPMKSKVEIDNSERELVDPFEITNLENLEIWLSCISSYTNVLRMEKVGELSLPPVFIVGTHADKVDGGLEAAKETIREIYKCLGPNKHFGGCHVKRDEIYTVDNSVSGNGEIRDVSVTKLKKDIEELSTSLPHMKEDIPMNWLLFEEELSDLVEKKNKKYISVGEAMEIANKCKVNTTAESKEFTTLLNYLHDLKTIIYFEETKTVFIDTQWLVNVFTKVIEVRPVEKRDGLDESWEKLEEEGVLERVLVEHVWKSLVDERNTIDCLLLIMEKFSLICRWNTSEDEEVYLVPCMLCNSEEREDIMKFLKHEMSSTMAIRFNISHVSLGIFPRLFVAIAENAKKIWPKLEQPTLQKNYCRIFNVGEQSNLDICVIQSSIQTISVTVLKKQQDIDGQCVTDFCQCFRKLLVKIFDDMRRNFPWMQNMSWEYGIFCPVCTKSKKRCKSHGMEECTRDSCLHFVNEEKLMVGRPQCYNAVTNPDNVFEEEAYIYWFPKQNSSTSDVVTEAVKMLTLEDMPSTSEVGQGTTSQEIVPYSVQGRELSVLESTAVAVAQFKELVEKLTPYRTSMKDPPPELVNTYRYMCRQQKGSRRRNNIKELRKDVPSGTTGPLDEEDKPYEHLSAMKKQELTRALCGTELLKRLLDEFGESGSFEYYDRKDNPVDVLLEEQSKKRILTVGGLYDVLVKCEASALADKYL